MPMCRRLMVVILAVPVRLTAALVCYNTTCLPPVAQIDHAPRPVRCPAEFRAKNYAKSNGGEDTWKVICSQSDDFIYGGISFYDGEGITGRGGLLRLDKKSRRVEVRRPAILSDVSINSIAADANVIWFGTTREEECVGDPFVHGLVRYDWQSGAVSTYEGSDDGPIGFVINQIVVSADSLWAATDLGLSRLDRATNTWHHFTPKKQERTAKEILEPLLRTIPHGCLLSENFENQLVEGLAKFRPRFLSSYLRGTPTTEWQCPELRFMSAREANFKELDRTILRFHPPGSRFFRCAVEGFSTHKHIERQWRDLLVAEWKKRPDSFAPSAFRFFRGDMEIAQMLIESRYQAIAVVGQILGESAIPLLGAKLQGTDLEAAAAVYGLELVSHRHVTPDGRVHEVAAAGSLHEFLNRNWFEWSEAQRKAVVAFWSKFILPPHGS